MTVIVRGLNPLKWLAVLAYVLSMQANAFEVKRSPCSCRIESVHSLTRATTRHHMIPSTVDQNLNVMRSMIDQSVSSSVLISDAMVIMTNVLLGIGGIATLLVMLGFLTTSFIIPSAVKQVEELATKLDPDLLREYQQKLGPEETLATRPDLLSELGNKVLALQQEQFEKALAEAEVANEEDGEKSSREQTQSRADTVIDVDTTEIRKWDD